MSKLKKLSTNLFTSVVALSVVFMGFQISVGTSPVQAAAQTVTVSSPANGEFTAAATADITISYTTSAEYIVTPDNDTITLIVQPDPGGLLSDCTSATTDADGDTTADGSFGSFTNTTAVYTFTSDTTTASTTGVDLCIQLPASTTQGSYSISFTDTNGDFGGALAYGSDDNDVNVTAIVGPTLSFNIRTLDDSSDTNVCDLGSLDTLTAPNADLTDDGDGECGYALAIGTNAANGFQAQINGNGGGLTSGTHTFADIADGGSFAAGTEAYGLANVTGAQSGNDGSGNFNTAITEDNPTPNFSTNASPVPTAATNFVSHGASIDYEAGTGATDTTRVMHASAISAATPTGVYTQTITYTVTATF